MPYVTSVHNPGQDWYYFPELTIDQAIVFKNFDSDRTADMGCLHGAFRLPHPAPGSVSRASVEARIWAIF